MRRLPPRFTLAAGLTLSALVGCEPYDPDADPCQSSCSVLDSMLDHAIDEDFANSIELLELMGAGGNGCRARCKQTPDACSSGQWPADAADCELQYAFEQCIDRTKQRFDFDDSDSDSEGSSSKTLYCITSDCWVQGHSILAGWELEFEGCGAILDDVTWTPDD